MLEQVKQDYLKRGVGFPTSGIIPTMRDYALKIRIRSVRARVRSLMVLTSFIFYHHISPHAKVTESPHRKCQCNEIQAIHSQRPEHGNLFAIRIEGLLTAPKRTAEHRTNSTSRASLNGRERSDREGITGTEHKAAKGTVTLRTREGRTLPNASHTRTAGGTTENYKEVYLSCQW